MMEIDTLVNSNNFFSAKFSDSLLGDVIDKIEPEHLEKLLKKTLKERYFYLTDGRPVKLKHFDGTYEFSHFFCVQATQSQIERIVVCNNIGEELETTWKMIHEAEFDIVTLDAKYFHYNQLNKIKMGMKRDFFVRIKKEDARKLGPIEKFKEISNLKYSEFITERVKDTDEENGVSYEVEYIKLKATSKTPYEVLVGKITRCRIRKKSALEKAEGEQFFVTSMTDLNANDIYNISMAHWQIETIFKMLKEALLSVHCYKKSARGALNLMTMFGIAYNIISRMNEFLEGELRINTRRVTIEILRKIILCMMKRREKRKERC